MFEGVITGVLNQFLGQFLEGFNTNDLKLSIWSGNVDLNNVRIKSSGLDFLNLPIEIKSGYVSKLFINANWRKLTSQPVRVIIDGVYASVQTRKNFNIDQKQALEAAIKNKIAALKANEDIKLQLELQKYIQHQHKQQNNNSSDNDDKQEQQSAAARYISKIIENLQIQVQNIHIAYEDVVESQNVQIGVCLGGLNVQTTDEQWQNKYIDATQQYSYKLVSLSQLFVYSSTGKAAINKQTGFIQLPTPQQVLSDNNNHMIIESIDGFFRLRLNKKTEPQPKIKAESLIESIKLSLSEKQYSAVLRIVSHVSQAQQKVNSLMRVDEITREGTTYDKKRYVELYKRTLNALWLPDLDNDERNEKHKFETELSMDTILEYRKLAWRELRNELPQGSKFILSRQEALKQQGGIVYKTAKRVTGLVSWAIGWGYNQTSDDGYSHNQLTDEQQNNIENELDDTDESSDQIVDPNALPKEYHLADAVFKLPELSISLTDTDFLPLTILSITGATVSVLKRPTSLKITATLDDMIMRDHYTDNSYYPQLITRVKHVDGHILNLIFEQNPIDDSNLDQRIILNLVAPQLVTHALFIGRLIQFFALPPDIDLGDIQGM